MPPLTMTAPAAPDPSRRPQPMELFPGADLGTPPPGWKPARREPLGTTKSGTRILTDEEREQFLRRSWLGVSDAAAVIGVSMQTCRNYVADGTLDAIVISRDSSGAVEHLRIETATVRRFLAERRASARAGMKR